MNNYPINIFSKDITALVIGAGEVGLRKIETLLLQGVESIYVIDKNLEENNFKYSTNSFVKFIQKEFSVDDLKGINLVFIATDNKELNSSIAKRCKERNLLCNVITNPHEGAFSLPALVRRDELLLTLSSGGLSPALSRALKADIENFLDTGYAELCSFLGRLRPKILELNLPSKENTEIFRFFVSNPQKDCLLTYFTEKTEENMKTVMEYIEKNFDTNLQLIIQGELC